MMAWSKRKAHFFIGQVTGILEMRQYPSLDCEVLIKDHYTTAVYTEDNANKIFDYVLKSLEALNKRTTYTCTVPKYESECDSAIVVDSDSSLINPKIKQKHNHDWFKSSLSSSKSSICSTSKVTATVLTILQATGKAAIFSEQSGWRVQFKPGIMTNLYLNLRTSWLGEKYTTPGYKVVKRLIPGDHIVVYRGVYFHHGIFIGNHNNEISVIHYGTEEFKRENDSPVKIQIDSFDTFLGKDATLLLRGHYPYWTFLHEEVVARAMSKLKTGDFNIVYQNCEYFATWCKMGRALSSQSSNLVNHFKKVFDSFFEHKMDSRKIKEVAIGNFVVKQKTEENLNDKQKAVSQM